MLQRNDIPPSAFPRRRGPAGYQRFDVTASALPYRKGAQPALLGMPTAAAPAPTGFAVATEWLGRLAAVVAAILLVLVMLSIHKGLLVQHSARTIVDNFRKTNEMFTQRADLTAPATARKELEELKGILTQLNIATATDVDHLGALLPDATALLAAGRGDTHIAGQLQTVATTLQGSAASLHHISADANTTVSEVSGALTQALDLVGQLNTELTRTTDKLAPLPAQDALIPAPGGHR
ncbi:hypothetical protein [Nocardia africana]